MINTNKKYKKTGKKEDQFKVIFLNQENYNTLKEYAIKNTISMQNLLNNVILKEYFNK